MWSALDWTGMLSSGEGAPNASAPSDAPGATHVPTARPVDKNKKRMSSSRTIHAEAIEVIADPDKMDKASKNWDRNSDTGSETDSDTDLDRAVVKESKTKKRICIIIVLALLLAALVSGSFAKKAEEEEMGKSLQGLASTDYSCSANGTVDFESADVILNLEGMEREATESELNQVQNTVSSVYNEVSDGCEDYYQRIMANATVIEQALVQDSKGAKHLTMGIKTTLACDGCAAEDEILFGGDDEEEKGERKLRSGIRGTVPSYKTPATTGRKHRALKSSTKGSSTKGSKKSSVNSQEFIDELDASLQASGMGITNVKEGYVYKQKAGKKKTDKVKMAPTKKNKDKKEEKDTDEIYKGDLKQDDRRQRRH
ncbi:unnamed protein product [Cylindrotheca closterium]|uniref:Uncharacterized protein n=1 Tax=Cylindrotheca closterium TaxID=2856 RepID=A0AAD2CFP5_9STRA|nr:unnamed protein product [Cylindrotheca closterium]